MFAHKNLLETAEQWRAVKLNKAAQIRRNAPRDCVIKSVKSNGNIVACTHALNASCKQVIFPDGREVHWTWHIFVPHSNKARARLVFTLDLRWVDADPCHVLSVCKSVWTSRHMSRGFSA